MIDTTYKITLTTHNPAIFNAIKALDIDSLQITPINPHKQQQRSYYHKLTSTDASDAFVRDFIKDHYNTFYVDGFKCSAVKDNIPDDIHLRSINLSFEKYCTRIGKRRDGTIVRCWLLRRDKANEFDALNA